MSDETPAVEPKMVDCPKCGWQYDHGNGTHAPWPPDATQPSITDMAPGTTCDYCDGRGYDFEDDGLSQSAGSCWKCHGTGRVAVDIDAMSPGTTFVEAIRWEVRRDSGGFTYALRDGTSRYAETFDPSTIRDVTPPPTTPEGTPT